MIGIPLLGYLVSKETIQAPVAATRGQRSSGLAHQLRLMVRIISRRLSTLAARSLPVVVTVVFVVLLDKLFVGMVSPPLYSGDLRTLASSTNGGMISLLSLMLASIVFLRGRLSTGTVEDELQDIRFFRHEIQERLSEFGANINVKGRKQATDRLSSLSDRASQVKDASVYSLPFIFGGIGGGLRELQTMGTKEGWLDSDLKNEISGLRNDVLSMFKRVFAIIDILPLLGRGFKFMIFAAVGTLILGGTIVSFSSSPSSPDLLSGSLFLVHAGLVSYALVWTGRFLVGIVRRWFSLRE